MTKRLLMILVFALLLSGNAYAAEPIVIRKDADGITFKYKRFGFIKRNTYAGRHCAQYTKFAYLFYGDTNKSKKEVIYYCGTDLSISPTSGKAITWSNTQFRNSEVYKIITKEKAKEEKELAELKKIEGYKATCEALGFSVGTKRFTDCTLKLFVEDNKEAQIVQSSSGVQEVIIRDPAREQRIRLKKFNDRASGKCAWTDWNC